MKRTLINTGAALALGGLVGLPPLAAAEEPSSDAASHALEVGRDLLQTTNDLWLLLAGICNREQADKGALPFTKLTTRLIELDTELTTACMDHEVLVSPESEQLMDLRIGSAFEELLDEFNSICCAHCYGSPSLTRAFRAAIETGFFPEEALAHLQEQNPPYDATEESLELARLRNLLEPDEEVLRTLTEVKDPKSAEQAVGKLRKLSTALTNLMPPRAYLNRNFADGSAPNVVATRVPLERLLWNIRAELVRIAGLPGYDAASYDNFSDVLNSVFDGLSKTHTTWFNDVFDSSFRSDIAEALEESQPVHSQ